MGQFREAARCMRQAADFISRSSLPKKHPYRFEKEANMQQAMMAKMQEWGMNPFGIRRE